jgi:two-component system nitrate/nitrite sensor histidine kinase NarX
MKADHRFFAQSLLVRLGMALGTIVVLALAATISATVFTELSTGKAAAINLAGSLRMQTYWVTIQVLRTTPGSGPDVRQAIGDFEARLNSTLFAARVPEDPDNPTRRAFERVSQGWSNSLKPAIARAMAEGPAARDAFVARMAAYVLDVDRLVYVLEHDLEARIQLLRLIQGTALFAIIVVMFIAFYLMHQQVVMPLSDLLRCARRVQAGVFTVRAEHSGEDELGQLGQAFNYMVKDLSRSYGQLEARVQEKTEELARTNVSLEALYNVTRVLSEKALTPATLEEVMQQVERVTGVTAGAICAREDPHRRGIPIALTAGPDLTAAWCRDGRCEQCVGAPEAGVRRIGEAGQCILSVPLSEGGKVYGVMLLEHAPESELEEWKMKLLASVGHHIGAALATAKRSDEQRRIALLEERSVIARELHDSLAQSLAYLKIQVARLKALLDGHGAVEQAHGVIEELKGGLNNAHRELRELLTTFRLRMDGRGLSEALLETINEIATRSGTEMRLHDRLYGHELDSNEQIHVLQVVREALTNVQHHAHARRADVRLSIEAGTVKVLVEDDGVGIREAVAPAHHYGLAIMRDRAATLGGTLEVAPRPEGGTRVELRFTPRGRFRTGGMRLPEPA